MNLHWRKYMLNFITLSNKKCMLRKNRKIKNSYGKIRIAKFSLWRIWNLGPRSLIIAKLQKVKRKITMISMGSTPKLFYIAMILLSSNSKKNYSQPMKIEVKESMLLSKMWSQWNPGIVSGWKTSESNNIKDMLIQQSLGSMFVKMEGRWL